MDVLKYAHEKGCPWDEWTCSYAACGGHLDVLKYAHENGCPWDRRDCEYFAKIEEHLEMLNYLRGKRPLEQEEDSSEEEYSWDGDEGFF